MTETPLFRAFTPPVNPQVVDALLRCNRVAARGFEQLAKQWIDAARQTFEEGVEQQRRLSNISSLTDLAAWQGQVAQDSLQGIWSRGREITDLGTTVARDVVASFTDATTETAAAVTGEQTTQQPKTTNPQQKRAAA